MPTNVENTNAYPVDDSANPLTPDVDLEFELPADFAEDDMTEMEDGSVEFGPAGEESDLPPIDTVPHGSNLVAYFDEDALTTMADDLISAWKADDDSRKEWKEAYSKGLGLLGMTIEEKTEPFVGAAGVYHPLLAEAVVQFQAQAYKEILPAGGPVLTKVVGDETVDRLAQASRVQNYMNYQICDVMEEYDEDMDQLLFYLPLSGSAFKKIFYDPIKRRSVSAFVTAEHLTVPYGTVSLASATRIGHDFPLSGNDLLKYQATGFYSDQHVPPSMMEGKDIVQEEVDKLEGTNGFYYQHDDNYELLEMHTNLDNEELTGISDEMDDDDVPSAPARPYIVTIDIESGVVLSIRRNTEENDEDQTRLDHFVHYKFLPGLGFYGFGLIHMIGGLTTSVTSILRQLIDAGTFSNLPGGLKIKGMRIEGDDTPIAPGEFRDVDAPTGSIRDAVMALPYKEPSAVLAALLGTLVQSGQRFASIADMQVGDTSGQQQPVGTTVAMLERGTKVMSSIHKRIHKAQSKEFKIMVRLIKGSMPDKPYPYAVKGADRFIMKEDFDDRVDVIPVSDPNIFSMAQRVMLASQGLQMAQAAPEIHNLREAYRRMYVSMGITDVETILKPEEKPQPLTPMQENRKVLQNKMLVAVPEMNHEAHIKAHLLFLKTPYVMTSMEFAANIVQDIMNHISMMAKAQAKGNEEAATMIELSMFQDLLPQMMPPQPPDEQAELQSRQLDIEEKDDQMDSESDEQDRQSKERIAKGDNLTKILIANEKPAASGKK
jgi:hypothetical protein